MDSQTEHVIEILTDHFGEHGPFLLIMELEKFHTKCVSNLSAEQKERLIRDLIDNVFGRALSPRRLAMIENALKSATGILGKQDANRFY